MFNLPLKILNAGLFYLLFPQKSEYEYVNMLLTTLGSVFWVDSIVHTPVGLGHDIWKVTLYVCPNRMGDGIHSDHSYLETLEKLLWSSLNTFIFQYKMEDLTQSHPGGGGGQIISTPQIGGGS